MKTTVQQFVSSLRYQNNAAPTPEEAGKRSRFLEKFPSQAANVISYQDNPNCKCSRDLVTAIQTASEPEAVLTYIAGQPVQIIKPTQAVGQVFTIQDSQAAWKEFVDRFAVEMFMFRGLTIVPYPEPDSEGRRWLRVFFY